MIQYTLDGPDTIVLLPGSDAAWYAAHQAEVESVAQKRANDTGRVCEVFAADRSTILYQATPGSETP